MGIRTNVLVAAIAACIFASTIAYARVGGDGVIISAKATTNVCANAVERTIPARTGDSAGRDACVAKDLEDLEQRASIEGWDGPGSSAVTAGTVSLAKTIAKLIPLYVGQPEISALPTGSISFSWEKGAHAQIALLALVDGGMGFAVYLGGNRYSGTVAINGEHLPPMVGMAFAEWDRYKQPSPTA